jgi:2-oxoglutarate ferredoxin oxidoreductase subunit gamma
VSRFEQPDPLRIRVSGRGGQGIILAGVLLAQAAMAEGRYVVQTQSYGPEARLGASVSEVVVASRPIAFPEVVEADALLCLSQEAFQKYGRAVTASAVSVLDDLIHVAAPAPGQVLLPLRRTARELGREMVANVVGLGALVALAGVVAPDSLRGAIEEAVRTEFRALNLEAFEAGQALANRYRDGRDAVVAQMPPSSL